MSNTLLSLGTLRTRPQSGNINLDTYQCSRESMLPEQIWNQDVYEVALLYFTLC
eukprot:Gb_36059 [translate_table: standard]